MDAAEADYDAKLYKASGDILPELQIKLPLLIRHYGSRQLRTHVLFTKCEELKNLIDRFQEWPQLLDPVLAFLVQTIVDGFLECITLHADKYSYPEDGDIIPISLAMSRLLYTLCKVRGYKVIVRLLNNEPRYVAPMLYCMRRWEALRPHAPESALWEEKYVMLLWLSHLMLAPFELSTLSTSNTANVDKEIQHLAQDLPEVATDVLSLGFEYISSPSKSRESAVILLVRLALRRDMQSANLSQRLVDFATQKLLSPPRDRNTSIYNAIGHLSLLYALMNLGTDSEVASFLLKVFRASTTLVTSPEEHHATIRGSGPARKLLVKLQRVCLTHAIALMNSSSQVDDSTVNEMLEEGIQNYLDALGDKDSPVRMAASKALSIVALKLDDNMSAEIVEAVLGSLSENILVEDPNTGRSMAKTDLPSDSSLQMKRNISLVDPLKWHGLVLTLGHLLFRRSPPPHQLSEIIEALLIGLEFEQRSNVGTSIGNAVRDAACFGVWALSRKYSTKELEIINASEVAGASYGSSENGMSALQLLATRLILAACFDPSGNIRRGSSAALQELIGRHPDTITQGIPVVQAVDYQAVARRSRAMTEVAVEAAKLDILYHDSLLSGLLDWRGARAADQDSRRWAAETMHQLCLKTSADYKVNLLQHVLGSASKLKSRNLGTTAGSRHGLLLLAAAILESDQEPSLSVNMERALQANDLKRLVGDLNTRSTNDLEMVVEAAATFFQALLRHNHAQEEILNILNHCVIISTKPRTVHACAVATASFFQTLDGNRQTFLLRSWLDSSAQKRSDLVSKGRLNALSYLYDMADNVTVEQKRIIPFFTNIVVSTDPIETRIIAMDCLTRLLKNATQSQAEVLDVASLHKALKHGLNDYTNDQRGDIGSLLRLASLDATEIASGFQQPAYRSLMEIVMLDVVRLAAEKLNKVRFRAAACLKTCWTKLDWQPTIASTYVHPADISSAAYFGHLLPLLANEQVRTSLVRGLASSASGTTEEIGRACCSALITHAFVLPEPDLATFKTTLLISTLSNLESPISSEDTNLLPLLDFLTFIISQSLVPSGSSTSNTTTTATIFQLSRIWTAVQPHHSPTSTIERLDALIRLYGALLIFPSLRTKSLDKLTRLLLHRYPKIRNAAADVLFLDNSDEPLLVQRDWNAAAAANKPSVLELRKRLGVVVK